MRSSLELTPEFVDRASALLGRRAGLAFDVVRRSALEAGLRSGMDRCGTVVPEQYLTRLDQDPKILDDLLATITVSETYFFRDTDQFALLRDVVLPDLMLRRDGRPLRLWSAGCASGEEPYSLAILLHQLGHLKGARIVGTDVSRPILQLARQARYTRWSLRGVPDDVVHGYFTNAGGRSVLGAPIRDAVEFGYLNLAESSYPSVSTGIWAMDLILCRNVLLYFAPDRAAEVAERLAATLADGGWLIVGSTDPLLTNVPGLSVEVTAAGLAYRRTRRRGPSPAWEMPSPVARPEPGAVAVSEIGAGPVESTIVEASPLEPALASPVERQGGLIDGERPADQHDQADVERWASQIKSLVSSGDLSSAEAACRAARIQHGMRAELAVLQALVLLEVGSHVEASIAARQALYLDPELSMAHLALGSALVRSRDIPGARRAFRNAERLLAMMPPEAPVVAADDETAGRLAEFARTQLAFLEADTV